MGIGVLVRDVAGESPVNFFLAAREVVVGRSKDVDLALHDASVSRRHAVIERSEHGYTVADCDSRNGTRVNGVAIACHRLSPGDRVAFGDVEFMFQETDELADGTALEADVYAGSSAGDDSLTRSTEFDAAAGSTADLIALNAWQAIRSFESCSFQGMDSVLRAVVDNLAGVRDVLRVVLHLPAGVFTDGAKWIKAGQISGRPGVVFPEQSMLSVAKTGVAMAAACGGSVSYSELGRFDAVCLPVHVARRSAGCLYIEGSDVLDSGTIKTARAVAEAIGLSLTIWKSATHAGGGAGLAGSGPGQVRTAIVGKSKPLQTAVRLAEKAA